MSVNTEGSLIGETVHLERDSEINELLVSTESDISPTLTVILPTLNEENGIRECIDQVRAAVEEVNVPTEILVSDNSMDRTPEIAYEMGAIVVKPDKLGYGYAYRSAFEHARGEYVVMGDADTTYDFEAIPRMLRTLVETDADLVIGSRFEGEIKPGAMPALHRYIGNPMLTRFLNTFYEAGVSDAHSGFRMIRRDALEELDLTTDGMEFASEMIMEASAKGLEMEEVPITYHEREGDATLASFRDGWRHIKFMLVNAPGYLFSIPGIVLGSIGLLIMWVAYANVTIGSVNPGVHSMIAGSLLLIVGAQVTSLGIFATVATDPIRRPSDPITTWTVDNATLERSATAGLVLAGIGTVLAVHLVLDWFATGLGSIVFTETALVAFTAIVLGVQTVFDAFFLSAIGDAAK